MDRSVPIQKPVTPTTYTQQSQPNPVSQSQASTFNHVASSKGSSKNKLVLGIAGAVVVFVAILLVIGQKDSESPTVTPSDQQSQSDFVPESTQSSQYYENGDDFPFGFRDAFLTSCDNGGNYEECLCVLEYLEANYTVDEVLYLADSGDTSYMTVAVSYCI